MEYPTLGLKDVICPPSKKTVGVIARSYYTIVHFTYYVN